MSGPGKAEGMGNKLDDDRTSRKQARIKAMLHLAAEDAKAAKLLAQDGNHYAAYHCQQAAAAGASPRASCELASAKITIGASRTMGRGAYLIEGKIRRRP